MQEVDRMANRIGYDHTAFNKRVRFCPSCGTKNLRRHDREKCPAGKPIQGSEFWCGLCGFSFNVRTSIEWNIALRLFKEHRQYRNTKNFTERMFNPDIVQKWKELFEKPKAETVWPSRGGNSLKEKLMMALTGTNDEL